MSQPTQIRIAPPNISEVSPDLLALAQYLRNNKIEKQRSAILNGNRIDMFRGKRFIRALLSDDYKKAQSKNKLLPEVTSLEQARQILLKFPTQQLAFNVEKLDTNDAIYRQLKPQNGVPVVIIAPQQRAGDNEYFVWFYDYTPVTAYLKSVGVISLVACVALFQLWPMWARRLAYYVSVGCIILLGALMGLAVVRFVIMGITFLCLPRALWIFPNLFADVGILQSFRPLYSFGSESTLPAPERRKKRVSKPLSFYEEKNKASSGADNAKKLSQPNAAGGNNPKPAPIPMRQIQFPFTKEMMIPMPPGQGPTPPPGQVVGMLHPAIAELAKQCMESTDMALQEILKKKPMGLEELQQLRQQLALKKWEDASAVREEILKKIRAN